MSDPDIAEQAEGGRFWRIAVLVSALVICLVAAGVAYLWLDRRALVAGQISDVLEAAGLDSFDFELVEVGFTRAHVRTARIGPAGDPDLRVDGLVLTYDISGLAAGRLETVEAERVSIKASYGPDGFDLGGLGILLAAPDDERDRTEEETAGGVPVGQISVGDLRFAVSLPQGTGEVRAGVNITPDGERLRVAPVAGCFDVATGKLQSGAGAFDPVSFEACPGGESNSLSWPLQSETAFAISGFPIVLRGEQDEIFGQADLPGLSVTVGAGTRGRLPDSVSVEVAGGRIVSPGMNIALSEPQLKVLIADLAALSGSWTLQSARLTDLSPTTKFAPLGLAGDGGLSQAHLSFDLIVSDQKSLTPLASVRGDYRTETGTGSATAALGPLSFRKTGLQPQVLVPSLKGVMTNVAGSVTGVGRFEWAEGRVTSSGRLDLDDLALSTEVARIEGVNGRIVLDSLVPPVTAPGQTLNVGMIDAGFVLADGAVAFAVSKTGAVQLQRAHWPFAGGAISLSSGVIEPGAAEQELELLVEEVDLASFLRVLNLKGASGTGTVSGRVPILITEGDPIITGGRLTTAGPGRLSYKGEGTDGLATGQSALVFQALEDFRYTGLTVSFDGNAQDRLNVRVNLEGANPSVYDGYPFVININTEASFAELFRSATVGTRALELIRDEGNAGR